MISTPPAQRAARARSGGRRLRARGGAGRLTGALRRDDGSAVAEFPMIAVLIIVIALAVVQAALILHTRNTLIDAAVQGAHHASLVGATPQEGAARAEQLIEGRFGGAFQAEATATKGADGTIEVEVSATLPLVGLFGPAGGITVDGRALDEESW
ncbi:MAG: TadE family protein [Brachybacterium tyrofermentans]|uniref:TadE family protein n=1 Tax=Brachybacterium tyrofermentans TaxID=47848 RepID=A0ABW0FAI0_9MICO